MNLRDLTDDQLLVQIGGDWGVQDCLNELRRRLSNLRKHLSEALVGWDETCDKLDAAEAELPALFAVVDAAEKLIAGAIGDEDNWLNEWCAMFNAVDALKKGNQ